ncbi:DUF6397 family protein [Streptomyces sp. PR69]|uniref:DUF6397 family protein n=1 Tax=Streptomyces sp. PR69 TaxID=2984950 RepID=UPI002263E0D0|nr:DUF6397 family protein [Streptomyces sp. PR69]
MTDRTAGQSAAAAHRTWTAGRAARELGLRRGEFDLAVQLGHIRTEPGASGRPPRVAESEVERLRRAEGFPGALRERVRTVGVMEGAQLISISPARFARLARTGHLTPVRFYLNRYRAVVWGYLADEIREFARSHPGLLSGRTPPAMRALLEEGVDRRARNWRGRRLGMLLRQTDDPWEQAAAITAVLDPVTVADVVADPYERAHLRQLRPELARVREESPAARAVVQRLLLADDPDELHWHRESLADTLRQARALRPAPRPSQSASGPGPSVPGRSVPGRSSPADPAPEQRPESRPRLRPSPRGSRRPRGRRSLLALLRRRVKLRCSPA